MQNFIQKYFANKHLIQNNITSKILKQVRTFKFRIVLKNNKKHLINMYHIFKSFLVQQYTKGY